MASKIRSGIPCVVPALTPNIKGELDLEAVLGQMGGQNCHVDIKFQDGVVWLARIRLDDPLLPPKQTQAYVFLSEVFTLRFLETTKVPAPRVFCFEAESSENPVGVSYIIMEKISGAPLRWDLATSAQRTRILEQLVDIFLELEKHPFSATGSICPGDATKQIGGFAQTLLFESPETSLGPFATLESCLEAILSQQMTLIVDGELSSLPIDNYLSHGWRRDMIPKVLALHNDNSFFLKQFDDKGDHIMIDSDHNITGIIDWEFASTEPKSLAFSSPCMLWPVGDFYDGNNQLAPEEIEFATIFEDRGRKDMGTIVREGRRMQRFTFFNGGGVSREQEEFEALFNGLRASWAEKQEQLSSYQVWKADALRSHRGDMRLQQLLRRKSSRQQCQPAQ